MGRMFGMVKLQLCICGYPVTEEEMDTLAEHYFLTDSVMHMCKMGPAFQEPIDDDDATVNEDDGSKDDEFETIDTLRHGLKADREFSFTFALCFSFEHSGQCIV